jgi:hypothetical protein
MPVVKKKVPVRQQPVTDPYGPPRPPDASFIQKVFPEYNERTDPQWEKLLNDRVRPYETAVGKVRDEDLGRSEFKFEQSQAANQALSQGFVSLLTGGKTGAEAEQFAKENFGGQYLPAQAMSQAATHLSELTSDWNDRDWEISSQYQKAMAEVPGLREQMRESITRQDTDAYTRKFNIANLLLDEAWNVYNANSKQYNTDQQLAAANAAIRREQGLSGYDNRKDAVSEATKYTDDTGFIWKVRKTKGGWEAYQTNQKKAKTASSGSQAVRNSALREASDLTRATGNIWRVKPINGVPTAYDTGKKKAATSGKKGSTLSDAQKAENDLLAEFYSNKQDYTGSETIPNPAYEFDKSVPPTIQKKAGLTFSQAYDQLYDYAFATLQPYGRSSAYVDKWVKQRLYALYPGSKATSAKPRGG